MAKVLGVDVGGGSTRCGLVEGGEILESAAADTGQNPEALVNSVVEAVQETLDKSNLRLGEVGGVGVGVPAFMNPRTGRYRFPNIPSAADVDLKAMLSRKLKARHVIENDADCTALGVLDHTEEFEVLKPGSGSGSAIELIVLTLGTGIGGGVVIKYDGRHKTLSNTGGLTELGHIKVTEKPEYLCGCGAVGCVEATSSCKAIVNAVKRSLDDAPDDVRLEFKAGFDAKLVDELSRRDNTLAVHVMESAGKYLGLASANIINSFNPNVLAYTGGGASPPADSTFFRSIMDVMEANTLPEALDAVSIIKNPDAKRYGILGAAKAVL